MFQPPRCPYRHCPRHQNPGRRFYRKNGYYHPLCRAKRVPRFKCRTCGRGFSRQTFRADYRDRKPHLNARLVELLTSGVGLRQSARVLGLSFTNTELKFRKLARHLRRFDLNLRGRLPKVALLQFDELESYEGERNTRPLSVPLLVEKKTRYVIWSEAAPIRPRGRMSEKRRERIAASEAKHGVRRDFSRSRVLRTLRRGAELCASDATVYLWTDKKSSYPNLARQAFGARRIVHTRISSKLERDVFNPLFPINHTEAMARDLLGRLRRESWLVTKKRRYLDLGLAMWSAWRNYVRKRFNRDKEESPAQLLGFVPRRLSVAELLSWRQDWGQKSIHPLASGCGSIATWKRQRGIA